MRTNKALLTSLRCLEEIERLGKLTATQEQELKRLRRRYSVHRWISRLQPAIQYAVVIVIATLMYFHAQHLYKVQTLRDAAREVRLTLIEIESSQRGFLLTGREAYLDNYRFYRKLLRKRLEDLCRLIPANPENRDNCTTLDHLINDKLNEMEQTIRDARAGHIDQAMSLVRTDKGYYLTLEVEHRLDKIRIEQQGTLASCLVN